MYNTIIRHWPRYGQTLHAEFPVAGNGPLSIMVYMKAYKTFLSGF